MSHSLGYETEKRTTETVVPEDHEFSICNYPNPFNPATMISYKLAEAGQVKLQVFDLSGRLAATIVNEAKPAGSYTAQWNGSHLSSGTYFLRLVITDINKKVVFDKTKKMLLTR
jgi:hypothetical protein